MEQHNISFNFKARYFKIGNVHAGTKTILFVLHGYGQLAQYFIRKFSSLEHDSLCIIAPEGLSRFYLETPATGVLRKSDRVGATWMTKENRDVDIENYLTFLCSVYEKEVRHRKVNVVLLGFSQGAATASRWFMSTPEKFIRLILWAGVFPKDMDFNAARDAFSGKKITFVFGNKDEFLNHERRQEIDSIIANLRTQMEIIEFDGGHEIDGDALTKLNLLNG